MKRTIGGLSMFVARAASLARAGCDDASSAPLAPSATALAPAKPAAASARPFRVEQASSKLSFDMAAPVEKIHGRVANATTGELSIDPSDLTKTTGLVVVDLAGIELFQQVQDEKTKEFGPEKKSDLQNEHARQWLEISPDAPEDARKKNAHVEFAIRSIESVSERDLGKLAGAERKVTVVAKGELLLHGRKSDKTVKLEATFRYAGDQATVVTIKTSEPFAVGLGEHDVRPRTGFGVLAGKTLEVLSPKVAKEAQVTLEITANAAAPAAAPAASK